MIRNYFTTALRNLLKYRFYSAINILGLSIGFAVAIFVLLFVKHETSYDKHHEKHERIHRISSEFFISDKHDQFAVVPVPMGPAFQIEFPEVASFVRFSQIGNTLFSYHEKEYYEEDFYFADSTVFEIFTHNFLLGSPHKSLTEPYSLVLTEETARKYFDDNNPIGEFMISGSGKSYKVTGVIENLPSASHLKFDALLSATTMVEQMGAGEFNSMEPIKFWNIGVYTYLLLNENAEMESIHLKFPSFYQKYMKPIGDQINASFDLISMPLANIHLESKLAGDLPTGDKSFVYIFMAIAFFVLLLASINYMNMATARSVKRSREVGMRKVMGALRPQLIGQFLSEAVLLSIISVLISLLLVYMLMPDFNTLAGKSVSFNPFNDFQLLWIIVVLPIVIGLISGSYPAFYLSAFEPVKVLKGNLATGGKKSGLLRRVLVVVQFAIAITMIIGTVVVGSQLTFVQNKDLGFDDEAIVLLGLQDSSFRSKVESLKAELLTHPHITSVSNATGFPGNIGWIQVSRIEQTEGLKEQAVILAQVDFDYIELLGLEMVKGRAFDKNMGTDERQAVIVNEQAVKQFGWTDDPISKKIEYGFDLEGNVDRNLKVIGVCKDFHFTSLYNEIEPIMLFISEVPRYWMGIKINQQHKNEALSFIEEKWHEFGAKRPFDYDFLDRNMSDAYDAEFKLAKIFRLASVLTIVIALLGLLGLSSFTTEQRTKELGLRKIMGASAMSLLGNLYKEFSILIAIAFIIAIPLAWWRLEIWLDSSFIYHISLSWTYFAIAAVMAWLIGLITVSFHIIKAIRQNPVEAIRYE